MLADIVMAAAFDEEMSSYLDLQLNLELESMMRSVPELEAARLELLGLTHVILHYIRTIFDWLATKPPSRISRVVFRAATELVLLDIRGTRRGQTQNKRYGTRVHLNRKEN